MRSLITRIPLSLATGALLAATACGGEETYEPNYRVAGEFEFVINADGTVKQPIYTTIASSPSGAPGTIRVATTNPLIGDDLNGCPTGQNCFTVTWENFTPFQQAGAFMGIDSIVDPAGRALVGSDAVPSGVTAPLGGRAFGNVNAGGSSVRTVAITIPNLNNYTVRGRYWYDSGNITRGNTGLFSVQSAGVVLPAITFTAGDFPPGALVADVNASIRFMKTAGTCLSPIISGPGSDARHNGTSFRLRAPVGGARILARSGSNPQWAGGTHVGFVDVTYDQAAAGTVVTPAALPVSGSFQPKAADTNMNLFNGISPVGNWEFIAGSDTIAPLCIESYSLTIAY